MLVLRFVSEHHNVLSQTERPYTRQCADAQLQYEVFDEKPAAFFYSFQHAQYESCVHCSY